MSNIKICSCCYEPKLSLKDFYLCSGKWRSECKACTIRRNSRYQRLNESWKTRFPDDESRREYMRTYYKNNKDRFAKYREDFRLRYPDYYREYFRNRKNKNGEPKLSTNHKPLRDK